jgi:hypothetical protein
MTSLSKNDETPLGVTPVITFLVHFDGDPIVAAFAKAKRGFQLDLVSRWRFFTSSVKASMTSWDPLRWQLEPTQIAISTMD